MPTLGQTLKIVAEKISFRPMSFADAIEIASKVTGWNKTKILTSLDADIPDAWHQEIIEIADKVASHYPLEYALGYAWFLGEKILVNPSVLIPRPDTETLVVEAVRIIGSRHLRVLDLCTGSGCVALLIKKLCPGCSVFASDISNEALAVARENALRMSLEVEFVQSDLFNNITSEFDLIVSNPPYVPTSLIASLEPEISYEPKLALDGGTDGNLVYRKIAAALPSHLLTNGEVLLEIDCPDDKILENVIGVFDGFECKIAYDVSCRPRVLMLRRIENGK